MSIQRRADELVDLLRPDFVGNDGTASPSFVWVCAGDGTAAAPGFRFCADPDTGFYRPAANEIGIATLGTRRGIWNATGALILNDAAASTFMTGPGVTIQQGALDDEAIAVQSTDVAHGMTAIADTDTYLTLHKHQGTSGGALFSGFKDADGFAGGAAQLRGYLGEDADTTRTTAGRAIVEIAGYIRDAGTPTQIGNTNNQGGVFGVRTQRGGIGVTLLLVSEGVGTFFDGNILPFSHKLQNCGAPTRRWNVIYSGAADSVGTSRVFEIKKTCPVCGHKLLKGTGCLCILGEDRDYETAFCPDCGTVAMEELRHLPAVKLAERRPAPGITFIGFTAFLVSGNNHKVRADFQYGDGKSAQHNSTYLSEAEVASFLQMNESERAICLRALGQREWDALEETRLMEEICAATQTDFDLAGAALVGYDLQRL